MNQPHSFDAAAAMPRGAYLTEKQCFSRIGWAYVAMFGISMLLPILALQVLILMDSPLLDSGSFLTVLGMVGMYLIGTPVAVALLHRVPARAPRRGPMSSRMFGACLLVGISLMELGSYVGEHVVQGIDAVFGIQSVNSLNALAEQSGALLWTVLILICAPLAEELLFRKLLLDRVRQFGEAPAILLSGLLFGLFHGNFYQFFYAAAAGFVLAYVYLRTGRLRWCVLLHLSFNMVDGVILPTLGDPSAWMPSFWGAHLLNVLLVWLYDAVIAACAIASVLIVARYWRSIVLRAPECTLPQGRLRTMVVNSGMIAFLGLMTLIFVFSLLH